jgi:hypothetical protein
MSHIEKIHDNENILGVVFSSDLVLKKWRGRKKAEYIFFCTFMAIFYKPQTWD